jgi:hypothetical protein
MKTTAVVVLAAFVLTACGGGGQTRVERYYGSPSVSMASGPISNACLTANRKSANRRLCGCIQGVANSSLSSSDQRLAASFFSNPHKAQEIRQSDVSSNERFWKKYKAFAAHSERVCKGL